MPKKETGMDRLKSVALWQWGMLVILAGLISSQIANLSGTPDATTAAARGAAAGRAFASLLFIIIGLGLMIAHFVRRGSK